MKVIKLNGEVINIGEWDYMLQPAPIDGLTADFRNEVIAGDHPGYLFNDDLKLIMTIGNPLPEGATEHNEEVTGAPCGGKCLANDYKRLRVYPPLHEQHEYMLDHGVEALKRDIIDPIKAKHPKP